MKFETTRLKLIEISWKDLEDIHYINSIPEVDEYNTLGIPDSLDTTKKNIANTIEDQKNDVRSKYCWKILLKDTSEIIGISGLKLSNDRFKMGEIYYNLIPKFWGNGYATEVAREMIKFGFTKCGLHRIEAGVATQNTASIKVLEKAGMRREGVRRKILPIRGEWKDNYHYAILEDDIN